MNPEKPGQDVRASFISAGFFWLVWMMRYFKSIAVVRLSVQYLSGFAAG